LALDVSIFYILKPKVGDIFVIGERTYKVHKPPLRNNSGILWQIQAVNAYYIEVTGSIESCAKYRC
jgi:hypothetical protein